MYIIMYYFFFFIILIFSTSLECDLHYVFYRTCAISGEDLEALRISVVLPCAGEVCVSGLFNSGWQLLKARSTKGSQVSGQGHQQFKTSIRFSVFLCFVTLCSHAVLLCRKGLYALNTVRSVFESLPPGVLHEIIVVDDGTEPPLSQSYLTPDVLETYQVTIIRHVP